ncbi:DUF2189 domain-containing protein [Roseovarius sp.]|uniref:DUF2189 domain-containing protein n=1 Tax=Roseovarius sp. TaxID=1486281 RepID=UPI00262212C5|nr:DUF2189 domain-containing protein [Roseovarius sp.]
MVKTIGNPLTWTARNLAGAAEHVTQSVERIGGEEKAIPQILPLTNDDIRVALRKGYEDFKASRADVMFICLIYPVLGVLLAGIGFNANLLPLIFPVAAGFALLGPFAAVGLYEVSRRREKGEDVSWLAALGVIQSPNFGAILVLGLYLAAIFVAWILAAHLIWSLTLGPEQPENLSAFLEQVLTTGAGWAMIVIGVVVGFCFALVVLATSAVSFPLLLDHNVGVPEAIHTSYKVFRKNLRVVVTWGALISVLLVVGSIPAFVGLILVLPILGHATWHFYRSAVSFG